MMYQSSNIVSTLLMTVTLNSVSAGHNVVDRKINKMDRGGSKMQLHIRNVQDKSMNRDEGAYQLSHI